MTQECTAQIADLVNVDPDDRPFDLLMASFNALDLLSIGLAVTNAFGNLLIANRTAEQILLARDGVELGARGEICFSCPVGSSFLQLLKHITADGPSAAPTPSASFMAVQRPSGKRPLTVLVRHAQGMTVKGAATGRFCWILTSRWLRLRRSCANYSA